MHLHVLDSLPASIPPGYGMMADVPSSMITRPPVVPPQSQLRPPRRSPYPAPPPSPITPPPPLPHYNPHTPPPPTIGPLTHPITPPKSHKVSPPTGFLHHTFRRPHPWWPIRSYESIIYETICPPSPPSSSSCLPAFKTLGHHEINHPAMDFCVGV